jgi:Tol biopolymer transport system component
MFIGRCIAASAALLLIHCAGPLDPPLAQPQAELRGTSARIVFQAFDGDQEIFTMALDGSAPARLTDNQSDDLAPLPAPDGARIAFTSLRDGNGEIYLMNADGSGALRVTENAALDDEPQWSPDGARLAHLRMGQAGSQVVVTELATRVERVLSRAGVTVASPRWSPDGARVLWIERLADRSGNLFAANADGTALRALTSETGMRPFDPAWSPTGDQIVWAAERGERVDLQCLELATGVIRKLSDDADVESRPAWSPDGSQLLFHAMAPRQAGRDIYLLRTDGSGRRRLTSDARDDYMAAWLPGTDGVVFVSDRAGGRPELYRLDLPSLDPIRLTTNETEESHPGLVKISVARDPRVADLEPRITRNEVQGE